MKRTADDVPLVTFTTCVLDDSTFTSLKSILSVSVNRDTSNNTRRETGESVNTTHIFSVCKFPDDHWYNPIRKDSGHHYHDDKQYVALKIFFPKQN